MTEAVRTVLSTAPDQGRGEALARALVEEGLAACVSLVPGLVSIYRWRGEIQSDQEVLLVAKTTALRVPALVARLAELHPYEVPEILALPVEEGFGPYLQWVRDEVGTRT